MVDGARHGEIKDTSASLRFVTGLSSSPLDALTGRALRKWRKFSNATPLVSDRATEGNFSTYKELIAELRGSSVESM